MQDYTEDYLLDKQIKIYQPKNGYRASSDAVILSSIIRQTKPNDKILDIGSGTGAISLCLARRFPKNEIIGLEIQSDLVELSNKSAEINGFDNLKFINTDIRKKIENIENCSFNHVITNPPYTDHDMPSPNESKALAHNHHNFNLIKWLHFAIKMLRPQGYLYTINRTEAIDEILSAIKGKMGEITIIPIYSKEGQNAKRVIISARKDSHAPTKILPGIIIHDQSGNYSSMAEKLLRHGETL